MANLHAVITARQPVAGTHTHRSAGRRRIINHDISHFTRSNDPIMRLSSARALGLSNPDDTIQLAPELRSEWPAVVHHYDRIGLLHSHDVIWDTSYAWFAQLAGQEISVQYFNEEVQRHRDHRNWCEVVRYIGSKNNFIHLARELKIAVPRTWCFDHRSELPDPIVFSYPCYLKASAPAADGGGLYRCAGAAALREALKQFGARAPLQVQEQIAADSFVTLHYAVIDGVATRVAVTERHRAGSVQQATRFPSIHAPWHVVEPMAEWLAAVGLRGAFGFEVAIVADDEAPRYLAIGCNPWYDDSRYAALIAQQLGLEQWRAFQVDTRKRHLGELDLAGIEYSDFTGSGVVIVNWGTILTGRIGVIVAGPEDVQHQLKVELERRLW